VDGLSAGPSRGDNAPTWSDSGGMTSRFSRRLRWLVPAGVAAAIALAAVTTTAADAAGGQPKLPTRTAAQLLSDVEQANPAGLSGTIVETAKLGLPALPDVGGGGGSDSSLSLQTFVSGSHTMRVWYAGHDQQRFALIGQLSESDVVHNGKDLWTYSSTTRAVTHSTLSESTDAAAKAATEAKLPALTPQAAAERALAAIDPTTTVQIDSTARVARQAAYQLVLIPKDTRSLIGSVRIAVAAANSVPLRVQVFARGATSPAIQVGFTDVSFNVPDSSVFQFIPPAGSTVKQEPLPIRNEVKGGPKTITKPATPSTSGAPINAVGHGGVTVLGKGWTAVVEQTSDAGSGQPTGGPEVRKFGGPSTSDLLNEIATPVAGGRLVTSVLVSIFIADDGRIFAGPVSGAALQQVAATGHGL
jgi:outer membrane lipoprotein-sorting protein